MDVCSQMAGSKGATASPPPASRMLLCMNVPGQLRCMVNATVNGRLSSDSRLEGGGGSTPAPAPGITRVIINVPGQLRFMVNARVNGRLSSDSRLEKGGDSTSAPGITHVTVYERAWSAQVCSQ